jgi:hypothetical protein
VHGRGRRHGEQGRRLDVDVAVDDEEEAPGGVSPGRIRLLVSPRRGRRH